MRRRWEQPHDRNEPATMEEWEAFLKKRGFKTTDEYLLAQDLGEWQGNDSREISVGTAIDVDRVRSR